MSVSTLNATDAQLVRDIATGDDEALRLLYQRHAGWLMLRLQRRCGNPDLVAGAVQDTFVAVWQSAGRWRGEGEVAAWLWGISIRRLISALRGHREADPFGEDVIAAASPFVQSAEDELLLGVEHGDVGWALRSLSPELRATVQAVVIDGLTSKEAAGLLGLPQGTVKTRLRAAKFQLRQRLMPIRDGRMS